MKLSDHRYALSLLKSSPASAAVIHPLAYHLLASEDSRLKGQAPLEEVLWSVKKETVRAPELSAPPLPRNWKELESLTENFALCRADLPETSLEMDYNSALSGLRYGLTELFHPIWRTPNPGAARNVLLGNLELKGAGRFLPVNYLEHLMASGTMLPRESIHSFLVAAVQETVYPLPGTRGLGVLLGEGGKSIFLRERTLPRLAQLGPDLSTTEKEDLRKELSLFHQTDDLRIIIRRIMGQYAALAATGSMTSASPDNFLLSGGFLDEEEWSLPEEVSWNFLLEGTGSIEETTPARMNWKGLKNFQTTFSYFSRLRSHLLTALSYLDHHGVSEGLAREWFLEHLKALTGNIDLWETGEAQGQECSSWLSELQDLGFRTLVIKDRPPGRFSLRLSASGRQVHTQEATAEWIKPLSSGEVDSFSLTRMLLNRAARHSPILKTRPRADGAPIENVMNYSEYQKLERERLGPWYDRVLGFRVKDSTGKEFSLSLSTPPPTLVTPVSFTIAFDDRGEIDLPARKTYLKPETL